MQWNDKINKIKGVHNSEDPRYKRYVKDEQPEGMAKKKGPEQLAHEAKQEARRFSKEHDRYHRRSSPRLLSERDGQSSRTQNATTHQSHSPQQTPLTPAAQSGLSTQPGPSTQPNPSTQAGPSTQPKPSTQPGPSALQGSFLDAVGYPYA